VPINRGGIDLVEEFLSPRGVACNDDIAMVRATFFHVRNGVFDVVHGASSEDEIEVFRCPVFIAGGMEWLIVESRELMEAVGIGPYVHFLSSQYRCKFFKKGSCDFTVHKDSLDGIAYARTLRLRVNDYSHRHIEIGVPVHICDADPDIVLDHRHPRITNDRFDQGPAAPWDDKIDVLIHLGHVPYRIPTSFWYEQAAVFGSSVAD